ncbi:MAG: hypothetical protein AB8G11_11365 [Saprospiraceae bacterium]
MSTEKVGNWTCKPVTSLDSKKDEVLLKIIAKVQPHPFGAVWVPLRICYQVVNGMKFKITYLVTTVTLPPKQSLVYIEGHMATDGTITRKPAEKITELENHRVLVGGWSAFGPVTGGDMEVFNEANNLGVDRKPIAVSTQVVSGTNYLFICVSKVSGSDKTYLELVAIYKPLSGKAQIMTIEKLLK